MNKRPNTATITWGPDTLREVLAEFSATLAEHADEIIDAYVIKREAGKDRPCQAIVHHGPGHQSSSYCNESGDHEEHYANLPRGEVYWEGPEDKPVFEMSL